MPLAAKVRSFLRNVFFSRRVESELDQEVGSHLEMLTEENIRAGMSLQEAQRAARIELGGIDQVKEQIREVQLGNWLHSVFSDCRYAARQLGKNPGFTLLAAVALALGIGANTAIFSVFDGMLWRPLPVTNPSEIAVLTSKVAGFEFDNNLSYPDFLDYRLLKNVFADVAAYTIDPVNLGMDGHAERTWAEFVSGNYFSMLAIRPVQGRFFAPDEGWVEGKDPLVVLSYKFWHQHFGGDSTVVGRTMAIDNRPLTIIGIAPEDFHGTYYFLDPDFYLPATMLPILTGPNKGVLTNRSSLGFLSIARLQPGVTPAQAKAAAEPTNQRLRQDFPDSHQGFTLQVYAELKARPQPGLVADFMPKLVAAFMSLVGFVLLIACANVANLTLARASSRRREMATRTALGASQWRIVRQLLTESIQLAVLGGMLGLLFGRWAARGLMSVHIPSDIPLRLFDVHLDLRVFVFAFLVALLAGVLAGIIPAMKTSAGNLAEVLKEGGRSGGGSTSHKLWRNALVVAQVAVSLLLLVGAGFFVRSFQNSTQVDMGFRRDHVLMASVDLQSYSEDRGQQFYQQLRDRLRVHSGVRDAAISAFVPMGYEDALINVYPQGRVSQNKSEAESVMFNSVQPEFFHTLGVSVIRGRPFNASDTGASPRVAIVNEAFARRIWPNQDPIGKTFQTEGNGPLIQVVGMTPTGKYNFLYESPFPYVYFPMTQRYAPSATILLFTEGDPQQLTTVLRQEVGNLDPTLALYDVVTMESHIRYGKPLLPARLSAMLVGAFGLLGLVLASVGVYGVISYSVSQRTQELGIRSALGAGHFNLLTLVVRQGMTLTLIGVGIGILLAGVLLRGLRAVLYGVGFTDLPVFGIVSALLLAVAFIATYVPARRATKVDPMVALRFE